MPEASEGIQPGTLQTLPMDLVGAAEAAAPAEAPRSAPRQRQAVRVVAFAAMAAWLLILFVGVAWAALVIFAYGDAYCEPFPGGSDYGELRWSVWPPGPTCTFTAEVHGFDEVRGPYPVMSIWLAVLAVGGVLWVKLLRVSRPPQSRSG